MTNTARAQAAIEEVWSALDSGDRFNLSRKTALSFENWTISSSKIALASIELWFRLADLGPNAKVEWQFAMNDSAAVEIMNLDLRSDDAQFPFLTISVGSKNTPRLLQGQALFNCKKPSPIEEEVWIRSMVTETERLLGLLGDYRAILEWLRDSSVAGLRMSQEQRIRALSAAWALGNSEEDLEAITQSVAEDDPRRSGVETLLHWGFLMFDKEARSALKQRRIAQIEQAKRIGNYVGAVSRNRTR